MQVNDLFKRDRPEAKALRREIEASGRGGGLQSAESIRATVYNAVIGRTWAIYKQRAKSKTALNKASNKPKTERNDKPVIKTEFKRTEEQTRAAFYRAALTGGKVPGDVKAALHAIPESNTTGGEHFLPQRISKTLIAEPAAENPLREFIGMSNINGLVLPKITYQTDNQAFITDEQTALELELTGGQVVFKRFKRKVKATVSDSVYHGVEGNLIAMIEAALRSGLADIELNRLFTAEPVEGQEHMTFYNGDLSGTTSAAGADLLLNIREQIKDLPENFRRNARVVMAGDTYSDMLAALAVSMGGGIYAASPLQLFGKEAVFTDSAVNPVVGDLNQLHINYDAITYDQDKEVDTGNYLFVLTAWLDIRRKFNNAFRVVTITAE